MGKTNEMESPDSTITNRSTGTDIGTPRIYRIVDFYSLRGTRIDRLDIYS